MRFRPSSIYAATLLVLLWPVPGFDAQFRLTVVLVLALSAVVLSLRASGEPWFTPAAFPTTYFVGLAALPPVVALRYSTDFGRLRAEWISDDVLLSAQLAIVGWTIGLLAAHGLLARRAITPPATDRTAAYRDVAWLPAHVATGIWAFVALGQLASYTIGGRAHGEAQTTYDSLRALDIISTAPITAGAAIYAVHLAMAGDKFRRQPLLILAAASAIILATGERGALLSPAVIIAMSYHIYVRPLRPLTALAGGLGVATLFAFVQASRSGFESDLSPKGALEAMVVDWSSPTRFMIEMTTRADQNALEFESGSTYVASIVRQLPGVVSNPLLGDSFRTSSAVYRDLINLEDPDRGFGFAYVPEGYMNFGNTGVVLASMALAFLLHAIYVRSSAASMVRPMHYVYFIAVGTLPTGLRQNTLTFLKSGLYATILLSLFLIVLRKRLGNQTMAETHGLEETSIEL